MFAILLTLDVPIGYFSQAFLYDFVIGATLRCIEMYLSHETKNITVVIIGSVNTRFAMFILRQRKLLLRNMRQQWRP